MISKLPIIGTMRLGTWGAHYSAQTLNAWLWQAAELGFDTLDTADIYGHHSTNALLGAAFALSPLLKSRFKLIAKIGICLPESQGNALGLQHYRADIAHLQKSLDDYIRDLGVDCVDQLLLHRIDPLIDPDAVTHWMHSAQQSGRMRNVGVSNASVAQLRLFENRIAICANQVELSLAHRAALDDLQPHALAHNCELQAYSPLKQMAFDSALERSLQHWQQALMLDRAQLLLSWVASIPGVRVILGSTQIERLRLAQLACARPLPHDAWTELYIHARGTPLP
jgi:predicted oxidoreductase